MDAPPLAKKLTWLNIYWNIFTNFFNCILSCCYDSFSAFCLIFTFQRQLFTIIYNKSQSLVFTYTNVLMMDQCGIDVMDTPVWLLGSMLVVTANRGGMFRNCDREFLSRRWNEFVATGNDFKLFGDGGETYSGLWRCSLENCL